MDMDTNGFYGDTFNNGFGSFETVKRGPKSMYRWEKSMQFPFSIFCK